MSKPERLNDIGPEDKSKKSDNSASKIIMMNIVTTAIVCSVFIGVFFMMQKSMMSQQLATNTESEMSIDAEVADDEVEKGIILDLGDFTMNLADASQKRYLKVAVALEVSKTEADIMALSGAGEAEKSGGHGGHGGGAPAVDSAKKIVEEMEHYKPAIRDAVITIMTSKVADELATTTGKELAKDQIKEAVDAVFAGEREVIRVSFGQFIIQ
ncbi:flagellar basal body-associated FliL family protein [bacterium]|nr:flagellar basal body-associated FliL family protein [bacterium]